MVFCLLKKFEPVYESRHPRNVWMYFRRLLLIFDFLWIKHQIGKYIDIETEVPIPNTNVNKLDYDYFAVRTNTALKECTPSLGIKVGTMNICAFLRMIKTCTQDFAYCAKSCQNITSDSVNVWDYKEACTFLKKGWINSDGTINEDVKTKYNEISGMSENINKCFSNSEKKKARSKSMKKSMKGIGNPKVRRKEKKSGTRGKLSKQMKKGGKKAKNNHRRSNQRRKRMKKGFVTFYICK